MVSLLATVVLYAFATVVSIYLLYRFRAQTWYWHLLAMAVPVGSAIGPMPGTVLLQLLWQRSARASCLLVSGSLAASAKLHATGDAARVEVVFDEPQRAVTPGQGAVFYDGELLLDGRWIE